MVGAGMRLHSFLTSALDGSGWSWEFYSGTFNTMEVGFRAGLDILEKKKISCHCRESKDDPLVIQTVARSLQYTDCIIHLKLILFGIRIRRGRDE
jgi:hypothetical protein